MGEADGGGLPCAPPPPCSSGSSHTSLYLGFIKCTMYPRLKRARPRMSRQRDLSVDKMKGGPSTGLLLPGRLNATTLCPSSYRLAPSHGWARQQTPKIPELRQLSTNTATRSDYTQMTERGRTSSVVSAVSTCREPEGLWTTLYRVRAGCCQPESSDRDSKEAKKIGWGKKK